MKLNNPAWLKGSMSDALRMVVKRASARKQMTKLAEGEEGGWSEWLKNLGGQASEYANQIGTGVTEGAKAIWANPHAQNALIGAGVGAGLGGLNSLVNKDRRKRFFSDVLTGGLMGGAIGGGGSALYHYGLKGEAPIAGANNPTVDPAKAREETDKILQIGSSDPAKAEAIKAWLPKLDKARAVVDAAKTPDARSAAEKKLNELMREAKENVRATNSGGMYGQTLLNAGSLAGQARAVDTLGAVDPGFKAFAMGMGDPHSYKDMWDTGETVATPIASLLSYGAMRRYQHDIPGLKEMFRSLMGGSTNAELSTYLKNELAKLPPGSPAYEQIKKTLGGDEVVNQINRVVRPGDVVQTEMSKADIAENQRLNAENVARARAGHDQNVEAIRNTNKGLQKPYLKDLARTKSLNSVLAQAKARLAQLNVPNVQPVQAAEIAKLNRVIAYIEGPQGLGRNPVAAPKLMSEPVFTAPGDIHPTSGTRNMTRSEIARAREILRDYRRNNTRHFSLANTPAIMAGLAPLVYREFFSPYSWRTGENHLTDAFKARSPSQ
jgi:hypothetical protein